MQSKSDRSFVVLNSVAVVFCATEASRLKAMPAPSVMTLGVAGSPNGIGIPSFPCTMP